MATASVARNAYLTCYNSLQSLGWALVLLRLVNDIVETKSLRGGFSAAGNVVCFLQLAAFLEILHSALGLVPTGILFAFMQWLGRSHVLFAIVAKIPEVQEQPPIMITFLAWSAAEVIRYPHYTLGLLGLCPHWLTWLRYTAFIVLYPIGALYGEMLAMYLSLDFIKDRNLYASSFKWLPFDYHFFVVWVMIMYPFLWLLLYLHMFRQRRSKLTKRGSGSNRHQTAISKRID
ncbi:uncharacterized protein [Physcomitrium patens]|uniref:Very-long-chain (3R)-3-hydroxyacyl-CoA dehydratase n=1 Tax=Physcomitrium patens TaxID=3218 RepID=A9T2K9_PHYPA|nr:very-long-chain (3R)-3-hydroxyacyl-CoA dehydratase 2-like isoform X1 [Physcomitrium patens]PNR44404.1 hypothetical protein PHYPA_016788 [Physcomitrium patens]|eukprot:XP_024391220.1 very-long-chain (3R)-3-hydroxyacyl-CoA dehydratase 2-like isoform X1 [Physcomitrella patens]